MKKKSILAILVIALVLTVGLMVSCEPDPDPDELAGTWVYSSGGAEFKLQIDGYGKYSSTTKYSGVVISSESGTYTIADGYVTTDAQMQSMFTSSNPEYVFVYQSGDDFYLASDDDDTPKSYPNVDYDGPFELTGGNTYSLERSETVAGITYAEREVYTVSGSTLSFSETNSYKDGDTLLYKFDVSGSATCVVAPGGVNPYPDPYLYFYDDTYTTYEKKFKYTHNGDVLKVYVEDGTEISLTKQ